MTISTLPQSITSMITTLGLTSTPNKWDISATAEGTSLTLFWNAGGAVKRTAAPLRIKGLKSPSTLRRDKHRMELYLQKIKGQNVSDNSMSMPSVSVLGPQKVVSSTAKPNFAETLVDNPGDFSHQEDFKSIQIRTRSVSSQTDADSVPTRVSVGVQCKPESNSCASQCAPETHSVTVQCSQEKVSKSVQYVCSSTSVSVQVASEHTSASVQCDMAIQSDNDMGRTEREPSSVFDLGHENVLPIQTVHGDELRKDSTNILTKNFNSCGYDISNGVRSIYQGQHPMNMLPQYPMYRTPNRDLLGCTKYIAIPILSLNGFDSKTIFLPNHCRIEDCIREYAEFDMNLDEQDVFVYFDHPRLKRTFTLGCDVPLRRLPSTGPQLVGLDGGLCNQISITMDFSRANAMLQLGN